MTALEFKPSEPLTLGIEMEMQILDPETWELKPMAVELLDRLSQETPRIKPEFFQSMIEINTEICKNAHEAESDLQQTTEKIFRLYQPLQIHLASTGTHPFSRYEERKVFPRQRYFDLIDRNQWIAQRMVVFGLHIHIGMRDGNHCIRMQHFFMHYLHVLLALSAGSPYWQGMDTGLASSRITVFEAMPTEGHPYIVHTWQEFVGLYELLVKSQGIRSVNDLWWDLRPSPKYGTLELRICDGMTTIKETAALVALVHAMAIHFDRRLQEGAAAIVPPEWMIRENKWRCSRHGLDALIVADETARLMPVREQIAQLMEQLNDIEQEQGYTEKFATLRQLIAEGGSYTRQRKIFAEFGSLVKVAEANSRAFGMNDPNAVILP